MILFICFFFCALSLDYFIKRLSYRFGTYFFLCCFEVKISGGCLSFLFFLWDLPSGCCLLTCFSLLWGLVIWNFISFLRYYQVGFGFIFSDCYLWLGCLIYQVRLWNLWFPKWVLNLIYFFLAILWQGKFIRYDFYDCGWWTLLLLLFSVDDVIDFSWLMVEIILFCVWLIRC